MRINEPVLSILSAAVQAAEVCRLVLVEQGSDTLWAVLEATVAGSETKGGRRLPKPTCSALSSSFQKGVEGRLKGADRLGARGKIGAPFIPNS